MRQHVCGWIALAAALAFAPLQAQSTGGGVSKVVSINFANGQANAQTAPQFHEVPDDPGTNYGIVSVPASTWVNLSDKTVILVESGADGDRPTALEEIPASGGALFAVAGELALVKSDIWVASHPTNGGSPWFHVGSLSVDKNSSFDADQFGFDGYVWAIGDGRGPGAGHGPPLADATGGGYGDPLKRPAEKVAMDAKNEYITVAQAEADYGVLLDPETFAVLGLTEASHGNAVGVGLADLISHRLCQAIDVQATYLNSISGGFPVQGKIPMVMPDDRQLLQAAAVLLGAESLADRRIIHARDTLHLEELEVSTAVLQELEGRTDLEVLRPLAPMAFDSNNLLLPVEYL